MTFVLVVDDEWHLLRTPTISLRAREYEVKPQATGALPQIQ